MSKPDDAAIERGLRALVKSQCGVDDLDGLEPEFVDQLREHVRAVLEAGNG